MTAILLTCLLLLQASDSAANGDAQAGSKSAHQNGSGPARPQYDGGRSNQLSDPIRAYHEAERLLETAGDGDNLDAVRTLLLRASESRDREVAAHALLRLGDLVVRDARAASVAETSDHSGTSNREDVLRALDEAVAFYDEAKGCQSLSGVARDNIERVRQFRFQIEREWSEDDRAKHLASSPFAELVRETRERQEELARDTAAAAEQNATPASLQKLYQASRQQNNMTRDIAATCEKLPQETTITSDDVRQAVADHLRAAQTASVAAAASLDRLATSDVAAQQNSVAEHLAAIEKLLQPPNDQNQQQNQDQNQQQNQDQNQQQNQDQSQQQNQDQNQQQNQDQQSSSDQREQSGDAKQPESQDGKSNGDAPKEGAASEKESQGESSHERELSSREEVEQFLREVRRRQREASQERERIRALLRARVPVAQDW
ncbi:MAG: hypothetical protein ACRC46_01840 [Thermoguttaceae bacterium]